MNNIILCTDGSTFSETTYQYGAWFARQLATSIEVLYISEQRQSQSNGRNFSGSLGLNASDELLKRIVNLEHDYAKLEQEKSEVILRHAKDCFEAVGLHHNTYLHHEGDLAEDLQQEESHADLIILGQCGSTGLSSQKHLGSHVERIMRSLHTPCLITAQAYRPIDQILLAYDGSQPCKAAFLKILQLPFMQSTPLHVVQVVKQEDPQVNAHLNDLQAQAQSSGIETHVTVLTGDIEDAIQRYITDHDMSLLVMGIHGNRPIRNLILGHTANHMIKEVTIPVLLYR